MAAVKNDLLVGDGYVHDADTIGELGSGESDQFCRGHWPHAADADYGNDGLARESLANPAKHPGWGDALARRHQTVPQKPDAGLGGVQRWSNQGGLGRTAFPVCCRLRQNG